jgi:O-antigen ligase
VTPSWFSAETIVGLFALVIFAGLCHHDMRRAIMVFTAVGCIKGVQIGAFAGNEMVQGLLPVEALATVMFGMWWIRHRPIRRVPFNWPLFLLLPSSVVSLIAGFNWYDQTIALDHMKLAVSLGQILLTLWPIATYLVVANSVHDAKTTDTISKIIVALSLPSLLLLWSDAFWPYVGWSTTFALPASSLCLAEYFHTRSPAKKAWLLLLTVAPAIYGVFLGKAFYYSYVATSTAVICWLQARRLVLIAAPLVLAVYVVAVPLSSNSLIPSFVGDLVETETQQQSLGGEAGRWQLIEDGLGIWSRYPIFGVGPGNNYPYMLRYSTLGTPHNQYIYILMELGVVGLVCLALFAGQALRVGLRLWRNAREPAHHKLALAWLGLFSAMLTGGIFGDFILPSIRNGGLELFAYYYVQWILLGLVVSASSIERWNLNRAAA